jgi:preprotein translocase subunit SecG
MIYLITAIHVVVCFVIIGVVLLQGGKGQDIAAAFGGQGSQAAFGPRGAATLLGKATTWCAIIFMLTSITLSIIASKHVAGFSSVLGTEKSAPAQQAPAAPKTPPQK